LTLKALKAVDNYDATIPQSFEGGRYMALRHLSYLGRLLDGQVAAA
jgi:hypothetical protein